MGTIVEQGVSVVISLRTEYLVDPLSIDTRIPRLSWIIDAGTARGVSQSAYQSDWRRRSLASRATFTAIIRVSSPNYEGKCGGVHRTVGAVQLCGSLSRRRSPLS
jgi:hypothetical protein